MPLVSNRRAWPIESRCESTSAVANQSCQISAIRSTVGRLVLTMRSSHQSMSCPYASKGASGRPSPSTGSGPRKRSGPFGLVSERTAPRRLKRRASLRASPGLGPKPARHSSRAASRSPNFPWYTGTSAI